LFALRLGDGGVIELVNKTTEKWAPCGDINQLGHSLKQIIHAFTKVDNNAVILMAEWDIQDGFWRLNCCKGEEWNFCYVWLQAPEKPRRLVGLSLLQMGWVESEPYFCAAFKTAQDVAVEYIKTKIRSLPAHKFEKWAGASEAMVNSMGDLKYVLEVYINNFISCIVPTSRQQI
jgi:hypothetical protein